MRFLDRLFASLSEKRNPISGRKRDPKPISKHLSDNLRFIEETFSDTSDFVHRRLRVGKNQAIVAVLYLRGLTDEVTIRDNIVRPLLHYDGASLQAEKIQETVLEVGNAFRTDDLYRVVNYVLRGSVILLLDGSPQAVVVDARVYQGRAIEEPKSERTITGPRDGFVENLQQNLALVRKRLPSDRLKSQMMQLGSITQTSVTICYMEGRVQPRLLQEVRQRLENLQDNDFPSVLDTSYVAQAIEDHPWSPFPQTMATERPDRTVTNLLEGRVCLLMDGTPKALIIPATLTDMFQSPEDYYQRPLPATVSRWLRFLAAFVATTSSALYVAVLTIHYELIPQKLVISVAKNRALVPFTSLFEALALELAAELLREATNRLPSTVGQVIGVVGAIILGQALVQANLISPLLVIVVAMSTIASFAVPNNPSATALRLMRFPMILASGFL